jgi:hypothetical protein
MENLSLFTLLLACATFLLALAAFWTIYQNYKNKKNEYKRNILKEITNWAMDILNHESSIDTSILNVTIPKLFNIYEFVESDKEKISFKKFKTNGDYFISIINTWKATDLLKASKNLTNELDEHVKMYKEYLGIVESIKFETDKSKTEIILKNIDEHKLNINKYAERVIEEATKIKTKEIV